MSNLLLKLLLYSGVLFIANAFFPAISFINPLHIIFTGAFLGVIGYIMDAMLLVGMGSKVAAILDAVLASIVIYLSQVFSVNITITFLGALLAGSMLGLSEYLTHRIILGDGYKKDRRAI